MRRFRFHHHYYPHLRTAYGPRDRSKRRVHVHAAEAAIFSAQELGGLTDERGTPLASSLGLIFETLPMPRGGVRLVVRCPHCGERRISLYALGSMAHPFECRECLGLIYWRQYEGRRLEACTPFGDPARALWAVGRYRWWQEAIEVWQERQASHHARAMYALALRKLEWARYMAWCARLDELNAAATRGESYWQTKRKSEHTATMIRLDKRIKRLRREHRRRSTQHTQRLAA